MRFPADDIWKVRLGEQTRLSIPYERKPCPFTVDGCYVLERIVDVAERSECGRCEGSGRRKDGKRCKGCGGFGTRVRYVTRTERVEGEERLRVLTVEKVRAERVTDAQALQEGYESADEWRDVFFCNHGECEWVWTLTFELTNDVIQHLARQHGLQDPPQYVSTPSRALEDADSPTAAHYRSWSEKAEAEARRQAEIRRLEKRLEALKKKAA